MANSPAVQHGIIGDVLEPFEEVAQMEITYSPGVKVTPSCDLQVSQTQQQPTINVTGALDQNALYTLVMSDPDAPSRKSPKYREWLHWIVVNCPSNDLLKGVVITEYMGPSPPGGSGKHRYVFTLYKQQAQLPTTSFSKRPSFNSKEFAKKHNLHSVAANFFFAENK